MCNNISGTLTLPSSDCLCVCEFLVHNGDNTQTDNDDLVRLQLETLLAEKARLAHENSIYKRENLYLRGVVEYHQLTMQDVVYFDERTEQVTEVYPVNVTSVSSSSSSSNPQVLEFK
ncbi:BnaA04g17600D [Brassica napus]|uniref:(rape) hypothetical protein n=1 Tax=Brassica napus TaxID=3708 RepID=A0A078GWV3_BRANA|nr:unnamed protein product [Brassica napus]CDY29667.1 BnaA04g17600D [Brassica napus]